MATKCGPGQSGPKRLAEVHHVQHVGRPNLAVDLVAEGTAWSAVGHPGDLVPLRPVDAV